MSLELLKNDIKNDFDLHGVIQLEQNEFVFTEEEWQTIDEIINSQDLPAETVQIGDVGEPNSLDVSRFMIDVEKPTMVNERFSTPLLNILGSEKVMNFYNQILGTNELFIRRCQLNKMNKKGSFIGKHLDIDSNPDYLAAIIIHFDSNYEGGEFIFYPPRSSESLKIIGKSRSLLLSDCNIPHEVTKMESGERRTLVYFLSEQNAANRRFNSNTY